jgi:hypothetical protein
MCCDTLFCLDVIYTYIDFLVLVFSLVVCILYFIHRIFLFLIVTLAVVYPFQYLSLFLNCLSFILLKHYYSYLIDLFSHKLYTYLKIQ